MMTAIVRVLCLLVAAVSVLVSGNTFSSATTTGGASFSRTLATHLRSNRRLQSFESSVTNVRAAQKSAVRTMTGGQMQTLKLLSGGVAGTISSVLTNPLEVIKTQLQASGSAGKSPMMFARQIIEQDGLPGFFRGLVPTLAGIIPARSVYFYSYTTIKKALGPYFMEGSPANAMVGGFMAGIASNTLTNPIWMVRTRMQLLADATAGQTAYAGYGDVISTIWKEEGIGGFYKGITASYWGCAEGAMQFIIYEQLKTRLLKRENAKRQELGLPVTDELPKATYFFSAAVAKGLASVATYPHEVARTRLREQARSGLFRYSGMWQTIGLIGREEGRAGLYSGMGVHLLKVVPNSAIMFLTYEMVNSWLNKITVVDNK